MAGSKNLLKMKKFEITQDRYYWNQYCKGLVGGYPSSDNSQHLSVSVSDNGKVDNVVLIVKQPESFAPASTKAAPVETVAKQQTEATVASQPTKEKKGGNIWRWCLVAAGLLTGAAILGHHYWKSNKAA